MLKKRSEILNALFATFYEVGPKKVV